MRALPLINGTGTAEQAGRRGRAQKANPPNEKEDIIP